MVLAGFKMLTSPGPIHGGFQHTECASQVRLRGRGVRPEFHKQLPHWGSDRSVGVIGHAREEKIPGEAWIKVKISNKVENRRVWPQH